MDVVFEFGGSVCHAVLAGLTELSSLVAREEFGRLDDCNFNVEVVGGVVFAVDAF